MITIFGKWQVTHQKLDSVLDLLKELEKKSKEESGNILYHVYQSTASANTILFYECYVDEEALAAHRDSVYFQEIVVRQIIPMLDNREVILANKLNLNAV